MTPKQKAEELLDAFYPMCNGTSVESIRLTECKKCAIICVDQILRLELVQPLMVHGMNYVTVNGFYREVKNELEKL